MASTLGAEYSYHTGTPGSPAATKRSSGSFNPNKPPTGSWHRVTVSSELSTLPPSFSTSSGLPMKEVTHMSICAGMSPATGRPSFLAVPSTISQPSSSE